MELKEYDLTQIENYRVWGRTTRERNPLTLFWTGAALELNMRASELWVEVRSDYDTYEVWMDIVINHVLTQRFMVPRGRSRLCVYRMMNAEEVRNVRIIRDTQAMSDDPGTRLQILKLATDGSFESVPEPQIKLEFIGDSITSGEGATGARSEQDWISGCFSAVDNYAFMTAAALNAEYHSISQSGWGIHCAWDGNTYHAIPKYYEQICGLLQGSENRRLGAFEHWDFASWQPDVIIMNLGTNDAGSFDQPDWTDPQTGITHTMRRDADGRMDKEDLAVFEQDACRFLKLLRKCNPESHIIWCYGMLGNELMPAIRMAAKSYAGESGDDRVEVLELPDTQGDGFGARSHPGHQSHTRTAEVLIQEIRRILK
ncbi:MAG: SGNH/GDSL hydrolase family protein [Butyrivibrio sp.]|jgi:hypothetical protein|nr:SGNH/GDSL hydrolase family protein [Butyrivibrio sp.]